MSLVVALLLLGFMLSRQDPQTLGEARRLLLDARPLPYVLALLLYYANFPLRALRWRVLLENSGEPRDKQPRLAILVETIYLSWFVNTVVPAKLGDVYRGWLLRRASGTRLSRAMGTIVAERALDLSVLVVLMVTTGFLTYGDVLAGGLEGGTAACLLGAPSGAAGPSPSISNAAVGAQVGADIGCTLARLFALGALAVVGLVAGLIGLARWGVHAERWMPGRLGDLYRQFAGALVLSFGRLGRLLGLSVAAWMAEGAAFWMVGRALGISLGTPLVIFFSLLQAFITVIPATPGGLGFEFLLAGAISLRGFPVSEAIALTLLYRTISYLSLAVGGLVVFLVSPRTK